MSDQAFLQEIDEAVRRKRLEELWRRFGVHIVGGAVLIVGVTAAVTGWRNYTLQRAHQASATLLDMIHAAEDRREGVTEAMLDFSQSTSARAHGVLARFYAAGQALDRGQAQQALDIYNDIAASARIDPVYRQLADLRAALMQLDSAPAEDLEKRLAPVAAGGPWRHMAREAVGHLALREGDQDKAKTIFAALMEEKDISPGISRRAQDMVMGLSGGAF